MADEITGKIKRKYMAHYIDASATSTPSYVRLGADLEEYTVEMNANVETKPNILGGNTTSIDGYEPQVSVEPYYATVGDALFTRLQKIVDERLTLDDLKTTTVEVHLWEEGSTTGTFVAYKEDAIIEVVSYIISDEISGRNNPYSKVFNPRRMMLSGSRVFLKDAAIITISLLSEYLKIPHDKLGDIKKGQAGVIRHNGMRVGVYHDKDDMYYFVTTKCPHLGCKLEWNQNEMTWDCPCHGSRFDYKGNLINNPAMRNAFDACNKKSKDIKK